MAIFEIELKWNDEHAAAVCPLTQNQHRPWVGFYPFLKGANKPVLWEAIELSDPRMANEIMAYAVMYADREDCISPLPVLHIEIKDTWLYTPQPNKKPKKPRRPRIAQPSYVDISLSHDIVLVRL